MTQLLAVIGQAAPTAGQGGLLGMLAPMLIVFAIFYFLMIRPQQQQQKKHKAMIEGLKKGDEVITRAGIIGTIYAIADSIVTLEVDNNVRFKMLRDQIASLKPAPQPK